MKKILMLSVGVCIATSVSAASITDPFYVPEEGKFFSDTTVVYQDLEDTDNAAVTETLSYGVAKNVAINVTLSDQWNWDADSSSDKYINPAWGIGAKYNITNDTIKTQVFGGYLQGGLSYNMFSMFGEHHSKVLNAGVKVGYQLEEGFLPYASIEIIKVIGQNNADPVYAGRAALFKDFGNKVTADGGVFYLWSNEDFMGYEKALAIDASVDYLLRDDLSVGVKAAYILDTKPDDVDGYTLGANLKLSF